MATQVIGAVRRSRIGVTLIALALALAIAVVLAQASSIWSTQGGTHGLSVTQVSPFPQRYVNVGHIPDGCRPKYGCPKGTTP